MCEIGKPIEIIDVEPLSSSRAPAQRRRSSPRSSP